MAIPLYIGGSHEPPNINNVEQLWNKDHCGAAVWFHMIYLVHVTWALACGTAAVEVLLEHSWSQTTKTKHCSTILTHPLAFLPLQLAEEKLELFYCDAVAGEYAQHVYQ